MYWKCSTILEPCQKLKEFRDFQREFIADLKSTVSAIESICPIARVKSLSQCPIFRSSIDSIIVAGDFLISQVPDDIMKIRGIEQQEFSQKLKNITDHTKDIKSEILQNHSNESKGENVEIAEVFTTLSVDNLYYNFSNANDSSKLFHNDDTTRDSSCDVSCFISKLLLLFTVMCLILLAIGLYLDTTKSTAKTITFRRVK